jgi:hypothetical protein
MFSISNNVSTCNAQHRTKRTTTRLSRQPCHVTFLTECRQITTGFRVDLQSGYGFCTCTVQTSSNGPQLENETFKDPYLHRFDSLFW